MSRQIIIHIDGGLVQWVSSIETNDYARLQSVIIVDTDIEGVEDDKLTTTTDIEGKEFQAHVYEMPIDTSNDPYTDVRLAVTAWLNGTVPPAPKGWVEVNGSMKFAADIENENR